MGTKKLIVLLWLYEYLNGDILDKRKRYQLPRVVLPNRNQLFVGFSACVKRERETAEKSIGEDFVRVLNLMLFLCHCLQFAMNEKFIEAKQAQNEASNAFMVFQTNATQNLPFPLKWVIFVITSKWQSAWKSIVQHVVLKATNDLWMEVKKMLTWLWGLNVYSLGEKKEVIPSSLRLFGVISNIFVYLFECSRCNVEKKCVYKTRSAARHPCLIVRD